jgi:hypothetical protein
MARAVRSREAMATDVTATRINLRAEYGLVDFSRAYPVHHGVAKCSVRRCSRVNQVMVSRRRPSALFRPRLALIPRYGAHVAGKRWLVIGGQCAECAARAEVFEKCGRGRASVCGAIRRVRLQSRLHPFMGHSILASRRVSQALRMPTRDVTWCGGEKGL